jgi:hypothetical protein
MLDWEDAVYLITRSLLNGANSHEKIDHCLLTGTKRFLCLLMKDE